MSVGYDMFISLYSVNRGVFIQVLSDDTQSIAGLAAADFFCEALLPNKLETVYDNKVLRIMRGVEHGGFAGAETLAKALNQLRGIHDSGSDLHVAIKIFYLKPGKHDVTTKQYVTIWQNQLETHMTWRCTWQKLLSNSLPKLKSIYVEKYEQARGELIYVDSSNAVLGHTDAYRLQLANSSDHW
jgi:hypothetical protein